MNIDRELTIELKQNSRLAFDKIYAEYSGLLYGFVYNLTRSHTDSKDIVQETFLKVWLNRSNISLNYSLKSYLFSISKNMIIDSVRKNKNFVTYELTVVENTTTSKSESEIEKEIYYQELSEKVDTAKLKMTKRQKLIFELNKEQDYSINEIAELLNISHKTVYNTLSLAVSIVRDELRDENS